MALPRKKRTPKRNYLGSGAGSLRSGSGTKAKSKKTNRPYTGVLPSDKPSARKKPKSTRTKAAGLVKKSLITPRIIKELKKPSTQKAIKTAASLAAMPLSTKLLQRAVIKAIKRTKRRSKKTTKTRRR
jgi:hypothetical protein